jgi:hypothetical protein
LSIRWSSALAKHSQQLAERKLHEASHKKREGCTAGGLAGPLQETDLAGMLICRQDSPSHIKPTNGLDKDGETESASQMFASQELDIFQSIFEKLDTFHI